MTTKKYYLIATVNDFNQPVHRIHNISKNTTMKNAVTRFTDKLYNRGFTTVHIIKKSLYEK